MLVKITLLVCIAALAAVSTVNGKTCNECTSDYGTPSGTDVVKCTAAITYIKCLESATGAGCDALHTKATTAYNDYNGVKASCNPTVTDTCVCQMNYLKTDISGANKCTALKDELKCLLKGIGTACDATTTREATITKVKGLIDAESSCPLTETCKCTVTYATATMVNDGEKCTAQKNRYTCLYKQALTDDDCDPATKNSALRGPTKTAIDGLTSVTCKLTETCKCSAAYYSAKMGTDAEKCTAGKDRYACLYKQALAENDCDPAMNNSAVRDATKTAIDGLTSVKCALSDSCKCELDYATKVAKTQASKCTYKKEQLGCLIKSTGTGCDQTKTVKQLAEAAEVERKKDTSCSLTGLCTCQTSHLVTSEEKCKAANTLKKCVGEVTADAELACDGKTKKSAYVTEVDAVVKAKCGATGLKVSLLGSLLIVLAGIFFKN